MSAIRRLRVTAAAMAAVAVMVGAGVAVASGAAAVPAGPLAAADTVKYYQVQGDYAGKPENLSEIALRFLGDAARSSEIFNLNVGRPQPDGGALTDPNALHPYWSLVLPWDAVGDGVAVGPLPTAVPVPPVSPKPLTPTKPGTPTKPAPPASSQPPPPPAAGCASATNRGTTSNWAPLRMAPAQAWARTKGEGVLVGLVDSGVDGTVPGLTGRIAIGADIVTGSGRGNTDCIGSGTAMASIVVAQPGQSGSVTGLAPGSTVLPVRVVTTNPHASVADQVSAIQVAVSAGAKVLALGSYVDIADPAVTAAIASAVAHNVVVVAGAPGTTRAATGPTRPGVLRVAGVGVDNGPVEPYRAGEVEVAAPGVTITVLGITGIGEQVRSGTDLAVAYVAAEAALVRAAHKELSAEQVAHRVMVTADKVGPAVPDPTYGWGIIDPSAAVNQTLAEEKPAASGPASAGAAPPSSSSKGSTLALIVLTLMVIGAFVAFGFRVRHMVQARKRPARSLATTTYPPPGDAEPRTVRTWRQPLRHDTAIDVETGVASATDASTAQTVEITTAGSGGPARGVERTPLP